MADHEPKPEEPVVPLKASPDPSDEAERERIRRIEEHILTQYVQMMLWPPIG